MKIVSGILIIGVIFLFVSPVISQSIESTSSTIQLSIKGGFSLRIGIINNGETSVTGHYTLADRTKTREGTIVANAHQFSEQMHPTKRLGITTVTITCNGQELTKPVLTLFVFVYVL